MMRSPPTGLRLDVAGALLTKRVPRFALPSATIFDDSDIEDYLRPTILRRVLVVIVMLARSWGQFEFRDFVGIC